MKKHYSIPLVKSSAFAKDMAKKLKGGEIVALIGPLGSGKTTFAKALAKELKVQEDVSSPTFVIMNQYEGLLKKKKVYIYHLDLYRTNDPQEALALGLME